MAPKKEQSMQGAVSIPAARIEKFTITIKGDTPLIAHKWSEKAKKMMLDKQMKKAKTAKPPKDPQREYEEAMYRFPDGGHGFPARAFKAAAINACRQVDNITMTAARGAFQVLGELVDGDMLVRLRSSEPVMREDMVRIGMGTSDLRYRPMYEEWEADITVTHNADFMSQEQIVNLFNTAGFCSGIGEWRPSSPKCSGPYGTFHVKTGGE
jgi:hypothetical protein